MVKDHHSFLTEISYSGEDSMCTLITLDGLFENIALLAALQDSRWSEAIHAELGALHKNSTWELAPLPTGKKPLSAKWVLKVKNDADPSHVRMKARLVAKGYGQWEGVDYNETFALVVKWSTIRAIVALVVALNWPISHMDVVTAFLNGQLDEIYMLQPPRFPTPGFEDLVCRLRHTLYDLKQSPQAWYQEIDSLLTIG